jgi:DNA-binding NarL/FixJ family response regulator
MSSSRIQSDNSEAAFAPESHRHSFTEQEVPLLHAFNPNLVPSYFHPDLPAPDIEPATKNADRVASLAPRLRPVLHHLLAGDAEKQVAQKLGLSPHTVHAYTKALYRAFDVNSRGELLALFVVSTNENWGN